MNQASSDFLAIVLAAGHGTRMKSALPKVLHPLLGREMVSYPVQAALDAGASRVVCVVGHGAEQVTSALSARFGERVLTALQEQQLGTGDAARAGQRAVPDWDGWIVILHGDSALITSRALSALMARAREAKGPLALLTASLPDATGYGRIVRDAQGVIVGIREQKDCSPDEAALREFNPGVYAVRADFFAASIGSLNTDNAQRELYLTDLVSLAAKIGGATGVPWDVAELHGINDRRELAASEQALAARIVRAHQVAGVTVRAPESVRIDAEVVIAADVVLEPNVTLRGKTRVERGAHIDVGCVPTTTIVGEGAHLKPYSVASDAVIGAEARIGPFAHLRPGTELAADVHIGNFVEPKNTRIGNGSKANHLAYLGDGQIGQGVNVGAGTIFCNYDGWSKHVTVLEDGAFIGSDSQLVAPGTVGKDAYVGTGTTVTMDVPEDAFAIGRTRQENKPGLAKRLRARLAAAAAAAKAKK